MNKANTRQAAPTKRMQQFERKKAGNDREIWKERNNDHGRKGGGNRRRAGGRQKKIQLYTKPCGRVPEEKSGRGNRRAKEDRKQDARPRSELELRRKARVKVSRRYEGPDEKKEKNT